MTRPHEDRLATGGGAGKVVGWTGTGTAAYVNPSGVADILDLPTAETDPSLVLSPDGAGGVEFRAETGGGSGDVATDSIWDAKGDLAAGTGANAAARLAAGTNGHVLTADSGEATGMKWAAPGGGGVVGIQLTAMAPGGFWSGANNSSAGASAGYAHPINITAPMYLRGFAANMQAASSGTWQWGLFDYSASVSAATKLAGGSGALNGTGMQTIAAASAPVLIQPGAYMLVVHAPAANLGSIFRWATVTSPGIRSASSYTWSDTPDLRTSMFTNATASLFAFMLYGDQNGSGSQWL